MKGKESHRLFLGPYSERQVEVQNANGKSLSRNGRR
jgi:hypothetical protein